MTDGKLASDTTPGGHHRFEPEDVRALLSKHLAPEQLQQRLAELDEMVAAKTRVSP